MVRSGHNANRQAARTELATEKEARDVAEAARENEWQEPSFVASSSSARSAST